MTGTSPVMTMQRDFAPFEKASVHPSASSCPRLSRAEPRHWGQMFRNAGQPGAKPTGCPACATLEFRHDTYGYCEQNL